MIDFNTLLANTALFCALMIPGYIFGKRGRIDEHIAIGITDILTDIAMPFLVFSKLIEVNIADLNLTDVLISFILPAIIILSLLAVSDIFLKGNNDAKVCAIFSNCGFLGIPLASAMFPHNPKVAVLVSFFNVTNTFLLLTLGIFILSRNKKSISLSRAIFKPITAAIILGVLFSALGIGEKAPVILRFSEFPAQTATPLSMTLLGYELSKLKIRDMLRIKAVYIVSAIKLLISPVLTIALLFIAKAVGLAISAELATSMFIASGVSTAATVPAMTRKYGINPALSAQLTMSSTLFCVAILPLMSLVFIFSNGGF